MNDEGIVEQLKSDIWAGEREWEALSEDEKGSVDDHRIDVPIGRLARAVAEIERLKAIAASALDWIDVPEDEHIRQTEARAAARKLREVANDR